MIRNLFLLSIAALASLTAAAADRELTVAPGQGTFIWLDSKVPENNKDKMVFHLDLPQGMSFDQKGFINKRRYTAGALVKTGKVITRKSPDLPDYQRTDIEFSFGRRGPIQLKTNTTYDVKVRIRYDIKGTVGVLTSWYSPNGSLLGYRDTGSISGKSDWTDVTYTVKSGKADKMLFWFNRWAGPKVIGTIEIKSFEIYENGKKIPLNSNDFSNGIGGWLPGIAKYNSQSKTITLTYHGTSAQGSYYSEYVYSKPGEEFRSAPFFKVAADTPEGDYPIYLSGPGINEKIMVKVRAGQRDLPKNIEAALWFCESPFSAYPQSAQKATLDACRASGINTFYVDAPTPGSHGWGTDFNKIPLNNVGLIDRLTKDGFKVYGYVPYELLTQKPLIKSYLKAHPEAASRDWAGRAIDRVCPTYMMYENPEFWKSAEIISARTMKETKLSGLYWDIEFLSPLPNLASTKNNRKDGMSACFCDRCIKYFKQEYNITDLEAKELFGVQLPYNYQKMSKEVKNIIQRYPMEWTRFALKRTVWQVDRLRKAIKAVNADTQMRVYTGRYSTGRWDLPQGGILRWSEYCGVDWPHMIDVVDAVMSCHDLGFYSATEAILLKELSERKKPVILDISTVGYYGDKHKDYYARIMHLFAFCEAQGFGIWGFWELDGCDFSEISRAMQDVAKLEDFFISGRRVDALHRLSSSSKDVYASTWLLGSKRAVFIENRGKKSVQAQVTILGVQPAAKTRFSATLIDGTVLEDPAHIELDLPAASMKIILIEDISFKK